MSKITARIASLLQGVAAVPVGYLRRWIFFRFTHIDQNAKCPGCGFRRGRIECRPDARQMMHICLVCGAIWGESFVVDPAVWLGPPK